jgi:NADPH-dependent 2,4-dienoyl-CoA reductase/sulfur reductase-like enzyme
MAFCRYGVVAASIGRMSRATQLLVVGAGPTGLVLALQAHDHGARVRIVDHENAS